MIKTLLPFYIKKIDGNSMVLPGIYMPAAAQLLQAATAYHQGGQWAEAEESYRRFLEIETANPEALRLLGGLYLQTGRMESAVECLEKAARLLLNDAETLTNLGIALQGAGRRDEAVARYRQALDIQPNYLVALDNLGSLYQESGHIAEAVIVYGQAVRLHPDHAPAYDNYGKILSAAGKVDAAIACYEHALKLDPDYLEAMIDLGMALSDAGRGDIAAPWLARAQNGLEKLVAAEPRNVWAMNSLGNILQRQGVLEKAVGHYRSVLALRPDYAQAAVNLATGLRGLNRLQEAVDMCRYALRLMPESADIYVNLGVFLQEMAQHEAAVESFDQALLRKPFSLYAKWNKAFSLLALGRYEEGWELHDAGLGVVSMRGRNPFPERRWKGEDIKGKRLLLWCEQGMGDDLQFIRYARLCKERDCRVIVQCPHPLRRLFANDPFIDRLAEGVGEQDFDVHASMMSLPHLLGTLLETIPAPIPYLHISAATRAAWAEKFANARGFKVGLVWSGNPRENQLNAHMTDRRRSMGLDMLRPLLDVAGVQFYTLQMGAGAAQIDACGLRDRMIDLMPEVKDFEDTGAIIEHLDLVISVDTSVVHLAGGLGKPVWVMSRFDACWRWLQNRPDSPWYPTARIFGQKTPGDWAGVIEQIKTALVEATASGKNEG